MQYFAVDATSPAGNESANDTLAASDGPKFETVIVYVNVFPANTGSGVSTFDTDRSACRFTVVVAEPVSLFVSGEGSGVEVDAVAEFVIEVSCVPGSTCAEIRTTAFKPAPTVPKLSGPPP